MITGRNIHESYAVRDSLHVFATQDAREIQAVHLGESAQHAKHMATHSMASNTGDL